MLVCDSTLVRSIILQGFISSNGYLVTSFEQELMCEGKEKN